jgi:DNA-directed RNA polymerase subunit M/transcription elongation factor TFIIS
MEALSNMAVWKLKSCPRCNGDLFIQCETDGCYEECLLCGYEKDVSNLVTVNTVGQVKINDKIDAGQISYTDIQVLPDN